MAKRKTQDSYPIMDANGQIFNAPVYQDNNGNAYTVDGNGNTYYVERQNTFDNPVQLDDVNVYAPSPQQMLNKALANYSTLGNVETMVNNVAHRKYNQYLDDNAQRGATSYNTWTKEHPNLNSWGYMPSVVTLGTASYPFIAAAGDIMAETAAGQGISRGLGLVADAANNSTWSPWINTGLSSSFATRGLQDIQSGKFTPETAIDIAPLTQIAKPLYNTGKEAVSIAANWRPYVPNNPNRYYRIVGKIGDPIGDAIKSGVIRGPRMSDTAIESLGKYFKSSNRGRIRIIKAFDYPMFAKGKPWQGTLSKVDNDKPYIIRSKSDTGPIVWEESNKDFRHKGHAGIFRPSYYGDVNAAPTKYFEYWEPKRFGYMRKDFPIDTNPYHNLMGKGYTIDRGNWMDSDLGVEGEQFGKYIDSGGEQTVFEDKADKGKVLKVYNDAYVKDMKGLESLVNSYLQRNSIPMQLPTSFTGYIKHGSYLYPVFSQERVHSLKGISNAEYIKNYLPLVEKTLNDAGYKGDGKTTEFTNGQHTLVDLKPDNIGLTSSGNLRFLDVDLVNNRPYN